ncbi:MAG: type II 3-dehydroquinate dehydratase [Mycobacteriales bacterium]
MRVLVLNGPNLGRLGTREPLVYGDTTYEQLVALCQAENPDADVRQTDDEATMIGWLHEAADAGLPVVLNSAAWSHYSYALRDACSQLTAPLIEVHISQTAAREEFRHTSVVSPVATGTITGLGVEGYRLALAWLSR